MKPCAHCLIAKEQDPKPRSGLLGPGPRSTVLYILLCYVIRHDIDHVNDPLMIPTHHPPPSIVIKATRVPRRHGLHLTLHYLAHSEYLVNISAELKTLKNFGPGVFVCPSFLPPSLLPALSFSCKMKVWFFKVSFNCKNSMVLS